jgi:predicted metal-dependent hydrolase
MQGYITLNRGLHRCPAYLREYVALHELIHFLHHDHGPGFYAVMDELMPDWKERRKNLKQYACVLRK